MSLRGGDRVEGVRVRFLRGASVCLSVVALGCGTAAGVCGCHPENCAEILTCDTGPKEPACNADPALGPAEDDCGVFVSSSLGDDANPGTRERPVRTLVKAIGLARSGPLRVYACAEVFPEAVMVPSGVAVWGGLDCADGWAYVGDNRRTVLAPAPDAIPLQVNASELQGISTLADLRLEAADASLPGGSSIAMLVQPGGAVEVRRSELVAGDGANGELGQGGGDGPAAGGTSGWSGGPACSANVVPGGAGGGDLLRRREHPGRPGRRGKRERRRDRARRPAGAGPEPGWARARGRGSSQRNAVLEPGGRYARCRWHARSLRSRSRPCT